MNRFRRLGLFLALVSMVYACGDDDSRRSPSAVEPPAAVESPSSPLVPAVEPPAAVPSLEVEPGAASRALAVPAASPERLEQARARRPKSVVELQPWRQETILDLAAGRWAWIDLVPQVGAWHVLRFDPVAGAGTVSFHLQLARAESWRPRLDLSGVDGLVLENTVGERTTCALWPGGRPDMLLIAAGSGRAFTPVCDGRLHVRARTEGRKTSMEATTDFLRDNIWGGERLTVWVRSTVFEDRHLQTAKLESAAVQKRPRVRGAPAPARMDPSFDGKRLAPGELGLVLADRTDDGLVTVSRWLAVDGVEGAYATVTQPRVVAGEITGLDEVEASALVYLVAFDLDVFDLGFAIGTDHPRVGWSERAPEAVRTPGLPGPDGFAELSPLVGTGRVPPDSVDRLVATFTGGFKRSHGAFKWGALSTTRWAHHYGFVEQGTVLSSLQPGLSTLVVWLDGRVDLSTWSEALDSRLGEVRFARQNGVPLVESDEAGRPRAGLLIRRWSDGNWSGSQDQELRTVRAGACIQDSAEGRFLIYGYFSGATPAAMARVFLAYDCEHAMLLDMNALEHTYLAILRGTTDAPRAEHLVRGMEEVDPVIDGVARPRFLARADNRDFFYVVRKETS